MGSSNNIIQAIKHRRAIRKYQDLPIEQEKIEAIIDAALLAPSARHERRWKLVVVTDIKLIEHLGNMKPHAHHVKEAPVVIVVASDDWQYWIEDASIVAEHIWLEAENQGLSSCWTQVRDSSTSDEIEMNSEDYVKSILNLSKATRVLCLMPIGYPAEKLEPNNINDLKKTKVVWKK